MLYVRSKNEKIMIVSGNSWSRGWSYYLWKTNWQIFFLVQEILLRHLNVYSTNTLVFSNLLDRNKIKEISG
ncbi:hypothetical protein SB6411_05439 [Klebsiella spallanzanii]|uniref:Uncharacterized protein n=1 Tax=Klebsiella spallanzanii TaxID=2587528 RepID=A0ABY6VB19_9ENTR|nr:hypothetical protein SB6411_05439 [Klebsiella spallanzanii]